MSNKKCDAAPNLSFFGRNFGTSPRRPDASTQKNVEQAYSSILHGVLALVFFLPLLELQIAPTFCFFLPLHHQKLDENVVSKFQR